MVVKIVQALFAHIEDNESRAGLACWINALLKAMIGRAEQGQVRVHNYIDGDIRENGR